MFSHVESSIVQSNKCILLLDGIEHILGPEFVDSSGGNNSKIGSAKMQQDHLSFRIRNIFLAIVDRMRRNNCKQSDTKSKGLLVVCTSRSHDDDIVDRFDKQFHLDSPNIDERQNLIEIGLGLRNGMAGNDIHEKLAGVVSVTFGKSRGDIAQTCREAIGLVPQIASSEDEMARLDVMRTALQSILPESVRNAPAGGLVEMRVSSAKELRYAITLDDNGNEVFPLLGDNAQAAWTQLENIIVAPLCRWRSLDVLLYGNSNDAATSSQRKANSSGVLLTGDPGVGKTAIAYHCAAVAAGINPAIRLLEVSCTSLIHKELGGSERSLHKLFETARAAAPCILLLDGIENIAPVRGHDNTTEGTMDRLLSTLLTEMDGVTSNGKTSSVGNGNNIAIIGITHNPPAWIDPALLRPGRLEKCIHLEQPSNAARRDIFLNAISDMNIDFSGAGFFDPKDSSQLADKVTMRTQGRSAAEIISLCENAKMLALRDVLASGKSDDITMDLSVSYHHFVASSQ